MAPNQHNANHKAHSSKHFKESEYKKHLNKGMVKDISPPEAHPKSSNSLSVPKNASGMKKRSMSSASCFSTFGDEIVKPSPKRKGSCWWDVDGAENFDEYDEEYDGYEDDYDAFCKGAGTKGGSSYAVSTKNPADAYNQTDEEEWMVQQRHEDWMAQQGDEDDYELKYYEENEDTTEGSVAQEEAPQTNNVVTFNSAAPRVYSPMMSASVAPSIAAPFSPCLGAAALAPYSPKMGAKVYSPILKTTNADDSGNDGGNHVHFDLEIFESLHPEPRYENYNEEQYMLYPESLHNNGYENYNEEQYRDESPAARSARLVRLESFGEFPELGTA